VVFRLVHEPPPEAAMLSCRVDCKQSEICPLTLRLDINAPDEPGGILGQKKIAFVEHRLQNLCCDAVALDEKTFGGTESYVDHPHNGGDVANIGQSNL